ncbi:MAG TPA: cyclic pyranopterin monophosphate synthase MoaC [Acidimicrobiales bacterium]|jgi:cyclic pyranopterin phosphate synthase|nr:cyclic pyranopterin monophosphate synthase MoaC [Acidimicrobiales bacterium]
MVTIADREGSSSGLTHVDEHGKAHMVDVTGKPPTRRVAEARCQVRTSADLPGVLGGSAAAAELIESARFAGILAAKKTSSLIPLCHPIRIDGVTVEVMATSDGFRIVATASITERTGVEMEALTACAAAALVLIQPILEADASASIEELTLWRKTGGRSGSWQRGDDGEMSGGDRPSGSRG